MKFTAALFFLLFSFSSPAMSLSYKEHVILKKIEVVGDLPVNLFKLYRGLPFEEVRMIAGKFDTSQKFRLKNHSHEECSR